MAGSCRSRLSLYDGFREKEFQHDGAYTLDEFAEVIKKVVAHCNLSAASESVLRFLCSYT